MRTLSVLFLALCSCAPSMPTMDSSVSDVASRDGLAMEASIVDVASMDAVADATVSDVATTPDAAADASSRGLCAPCVLSSDCEPGATCVGGVAPRCGRDCSMDLCPAALSCDPVHVGRSPILGRNCTPTESYCGARPDPGLRCTDTFANYARDALAASCIGSCHRHDGAFTDLANVRAGADGIRLTIERRMMPPPSDPQLSDAEIRRLLTWLACGAP